MEELSKFHTVRGYQLLEQDTKTLTSAMEDYLEMIYRNSLIEGYIRMNHLSQLLNVAVSSATKMVQNLSKLGFVDYKRYGIVFLTDSGKEVGSFLFHRHNTINNLLKNLGVTDDSLIETELIEHNISASTLNKIDKFNQFIDQNPDILQRYSTFYSEL